jgi:hypothetical protein
LLLSLSDPDGVKSTAQARARREVWLGMNDEHILALIEAIDGTYLHAIHIFAPNAVVGNDEGHDALVGQGRSGR